MSRPHGVAGAVTLNLDDAESGAIRHVRNLVIEHADGSRTRHDVQQLLWLRGRRAALMISGVTTREQAGLMTSLPVLVARDELGLHPQDLLVADLLGLTVVDGDQPVGKVRATYHNGVHDVMVVETPGGLVDFPVTEKHVTGLDDEGRLRVDGFDDYRELAYRLPERTGR